MTPKMNVLGGFAVNDLFVSQAGNRTKSVFAVSAGDTVTINIPTDTPLSLQGEAVYLASSQKLKREFKWHKPKQSEFCRKYHIKVKLKISDNKLTAQAQILDYIHNIKIISSQTEYSQGKEFRSSQKNQNILYGHLKIISPRPAQHPSF